MDRAYTRSHTHTKKYIYNHIYAVYTYICIRKYSCGVYVALSTRGVYIHTRHQNWWCVRAVWTREMSDVSRFRRRICDVRVMYIVIVYICILYIYYKRDGKEKTNKKKIYLSWDKGQLPFWKWELYLNFFLFIFEK